MLVDLEIRSLKLKQNRLAKLLEAAGRRNDEIIQKARKAAGPISNLDSARKAFRATVS